MTMAKILTPSSPILMNKHYHALLKSYAHFLTHSSPLQINY